MAEKVRAAIVGASGYSGEELVRLLIEHSGVQIAAVTSRQQAGQPVGAVFRKFANHPALRGLKFIEPEPAELEKLADVFFLALPHGVAAQVAAPLAKAGKKVIDLSADLRLRSKDTYKEFYGSDHPAPELLEESVFGLPEIHRKEIRKASLIGNPGCYPTSILVPLVPLLRAKLIDPQDIIADSHSGVTGAGRKAEVDYLFSECNESVRPYGVIRHRHLSEIEQELSLAADTKIVMQFTPHLMPVNRGILTTMYVRPANPADPKSLEQKITECLHSAYGEEPFVRLLDSKSLPDTKNVTMTNVVEFGWRVDPRTGRIVIMSAIDNLTKGASGQAVQNMNIVCGIEETSGLL